MKHKCLLITAIIVVVLACLLLYACSNKLQITKYYINTDKLKCSIKFAVISDLHTSQYGGDMQTLINAIVNGNPDAVLLCGDIFDANFDNSNAWVLLKHIATKYPCYFVSGNHEINDNLWDEQKEQLNAIGVTVLCGNSDTITVDDSTVHIHGVDDIAHSEYPQQLEAITSTIDSNHFNILLAHRPDLIDDYQSLGADLVISGHAHGGQWRIPLFAPEGIYASTQGLFPQYTSGIHKFDTWQLLISRGLDKQAVGYPRVFNRPELVFVTIS